MLLMPDDCHPQVWFVLHKNQIKIGHIQVYILSLAFFFAKVLSSSERGEKSIIGTTLGQARWTSIVNRVTYSSYANGPLLSAYTTNLSFTYQKEPRRSINYSYRLLLLCVFAGVQDCEYILAIMYCYSNSWFEFFTASWDIPFSFF